MSQSTTQPINLHYVSYRTVPIQTDHGTQELTVLILDKEKNESYWKLVNSFSAFLKDELKLTDPSQAKRWIISESFAAQDGFVDVFNSQPYVENEEQPKLYGIPIEIVNVDDNMFCYIELPEQGLVENTLWN